MKASWEKIEKNLGVLQVEVDAERVAGALDKAFKKVVAKVNVPGFRKGKVPRPIFEKRFGIESLYQDAIDILLPEVYTEAIQETNIEPVDRPEVDVEQFAKGESFIFKAKVLVKPEVKLGEYKGIEVPVEEAVVTEEEVAAELERLQQRHAELVVIDEDTAKEGDTVIIDFEGFVDGAPFEGGKGDRYSLEIGSKSFIPGFEEQLIGLGTGDFKDVEVTFPEVYHAEELAGKAATFKVKLHEIKRKQLPVLDDEFAKDVSEFDTLDAFKEDLNKQIKERKAKENEGKREAEIVEKAAEAAEVEIPQPMIDTEVDHMVRDFDSRLQAQGMTLDMFMTFSGQTIEDMKQQMQADAQKRVRNNLVLEQIAKEENIVATEEDVNEELSQMAEAYKRSTDEIRSILSANGSLANMTEEVAIRKTVKFLVDNSKN
jgi:trigger factor